MFQIIITEQVASGLSWGRGEAAPAQVLEVLPSALSLPAVDHQC